MKNLEVVALPLVGYAGLLSCTKMFRGSVFSDFSISTSKMYS